ncbi:MAG TPA: molybdopterin-guanine dinucleotide biosynthesis protein B [Bacillota bacterium]|nr:molybdopterin-guanine dinucleotide biosynthesis protein B [Bacillota bacterium]HOR86233.1 molybdopterin-guanine dinucleotide biosynthesis protein B [Bacillota bacterium]HPL53905.1 molybdopterin-guanine dinucleotide biosynthesis protein B [Bacillota bacterium]
MIPVFSIVANGSKVGKTTLLCRIVEELKSRGYRVCTVKHDVHGFEIDHPGKDTWKHAQAGADIVVISSPKKIAMIEHLNSEYTLDEVLSKINNVDIIITEGFKQENKPKLEIFRKEVSKEIFSKDEDLFAIVTDTPIKKEIPQFDFSEIKEIVELIENKFLKN